MELGGAILGSYDHSYHTGPDETFDLSSFKPNASLTYSVYKNRTDLQSRFYIQTNPVFSTEHSNPGFNGLDLYQRNYSTDINTYWVNRKYRGHSFFYFGGNAYESYSNSFERTKQDSLTSKTKNRVFQSYLDVSVGFGRGRLEPVSDLAMALFLVSDALQAGMKPTMLLPSDINDFASLMASVRNQRIFDSRRKRIYELRSLYDFMLQKGWTMPDDPAFFTILTDNWIYNFNSYRLAGKQWTYLFTPGWSYYLRNRESLINPITDQNSHVYKGIFSVTYERYKPQSLFRNFDRKHSVEVGIRDYGSSVNTTIGSFTSFSGIFSNFVGYGWYPNSRTEITAGLNADYEYTRYLDNRPAGQEQDQHAVRVALSGRCSYFISYKTRLDIDTHLGYNHGRAINLLLSNGNFYAINQATDQLYLYFNGTIRVSLF
jgi:hypothetical protein